MGHPCRDTANTDAAQDRSRRLPRSAGQQAQGITNFVASVSPTNAGSLAVVRKLGFVFQRETNDDIDGLEHVYLLDR